MAKFPLDQVTLSLSDQHISETWTGRDEIDFRRKTGISIVQWFSLFRTDREAALSGLYLVPICWIENRKKWPALKHDDIADLPFQLLLQRMNEYAEQMLKEIGISDDDLEGLTEAELEEKVKQAQTSDQEVDDPADPLALPGSSAE